MKDVKAWEELCEEKRDIETLNQACDMVFDGLYANYNRLCQIDPWIDSKLNALNEMRAYFKRRGDAVNHAISLLF